MHWSEADNVADQIMGCGWTIRRMGKKRTPRGEDPKRRGHHGSHSEATGNTTKSAPTGVTQPDQISYLHCKDFYR